MRHVAESLVRRMLHDFSDLERWTTAQVEAVVQHFALEVEVMRAEAELGHGLGIRCVDAACEPCAVAACPLESPTHYAPGGCKDCGAI